MAERNEIWNELSALLTKFEEQKKQIYVHYQGLVSATLDNRITSEREIEASAKFDLVVDYILQKHVRRDIQNICNVDQRFKLRKFDSTLNYTDMHRA